MSPLVRWILAVVCAVGLIALIVGIGFFSLLALAFGADSCPQIGNGVSGLFLYGAPAVMILGVIVAAILFGLNKRWPIWLGTLAAGGVLGFCAYVSAFALMVQACK